VTSVRWVSSVSTRLMLPAVSRVTVMRPSLSMPSVTVRLASVLASLTSTADSVHHVSSATTGPLASV